MKWKFAAAAFAAVVMSLEEPRPLKADVPPPGVCMICVDGIHEFTSWPPGRFVAGLVWGGECPGGGPDCVKCDEFIWLDGDCDDDEAVSCTRPIRRSGCQRKLRWSGLKRLDVFPSAPRKSFLLLS
jgi:hypothetical protein